MKKNRAALTRDTHRVHISKDDFSDTVKFIDAAKKAAIGSDEFHALLLAAIAMYAKPFGRNELSETAAAVPTLKVKGLQLLALLGPKGAALHRRIRRLRNKVVAHAESEFNPMQVMPQTVPDPPGAHTAMITVSRRWHPAQENIDLDEFRGIAEKMRTYALNRMGELAHEIAAS
jgi:hypothetical protein